jgi:hypothetical protein
MTKPPVEAQWYLPTNVSVCFNGSWITASDFCSRQKVQIHVITAWNPGSERPEMNENDVQNGKLRDELHALGFEVLEALGSDPNSEHAEKSWAVIGLTDELATHLGKKYGQLAIFRITRSQQSVVGCFSNWEVSRNY